MFGKYRFSESANIVTPKILGPKSEELLRINLGSSLKA